MDINSLLTGLVSNASQQDNGASLLSAIAQYQQMLAANQDATNQLGVNPQILQGQQQVDLGRINAAQGILNSPLEQTTQPWIQNTGPGSAQAQIAGLLSQGRPAFNPGNSGPFTPNWGAIGASLAAQSNYDKQLSDAQIRAITDTSILSPGQRQMLDEQMQGGRLDQASALLAGTKPQPGVDPGLLTKFGEGAAALLANQDKSRADLAGAGLQALSTQNTNQMGLQKAAMEGQNQLDVQNLKNQGDLATATAKATQEQTELSPSVRAKYQEQVLGLTKMGQDLSVMSKLWEPGFGSDIYKTQLALADAAAKKGINYTPVGVSSESLQNYNEFKRGIHQIVIDAKNLINDKTSARNMDKLEASIFDPHNPPDEQRANLVNLLVENQINKELHLKVLNAGLNNNKDVGDLGSKLAQEVTPEQRQAIRDRIIQEHPNLAPQSPHTTGANGQAIKPGSGPTQAGAQAYLLKLQQQQGQQG